MKKSDIIDAIFQNNGEYYKQDIEIIVNQVFDIIKLGLTTEDKVMISNFGTFEKIVQDDYMGVNPYTGERQQFKGGYRIRFVSSKSLKDSLNKKEE